MWKVAAWKAINDKPTENPEQEKMVLKGAETFARRDGIDQDTCRAFIQAQMDAAKEIQDTFRAQWKEQGKIPEMDQEIDEIRQEIKAISEKILQQISNCLKSRRPIDEMKNQFIQSLVTDNLSEHRKTILFDQLVAITLQKKDCLHIAP